MTQLQKSFQVLLIGDTCIDRTVYVKNIRQNPESDTAPLLTKDRVTNESGMAHNVFRALTALGIKTTFHRPLTNISRKTRFVDINNKQQLFRVDEDKITDIYVLRDKAYYENFDAIVISDYNKGFVHHSTIINLLSLFKGPIFLDTKKHHMQMFRGCIIKINDKEYSLAQDMPDIGVIVTEGADGVYVPSSAERYPAMSVPVVDVSGAGDAFFAGLVYGHYVEATEPIVYGIVNAGISIQHLGFYSPSFKELEIGVARYYEKLRNK